jgi:hypothetical protein
LYRRLAFGRHKALPGLVSGLTLHAAVRSGADDRQALEQLCRYITRPALANERVQTNAAGQVVLKLKTAWRDGTTHLVMSPLEFMQRLAALVPRPRLHLIRFHGVLAPNAKLRALVVPQVVPQEPEAPEQEAKPTDCEANCAHHRLVLRALRTLYPTVVLPLFCRVRGAVGKEKGRLKSLSLAGLRSAPKKVSFSSASRRSRYPYLIHFPHCQDTARVPTGVPIDGIRSADQNRA